MSETGLSESSTPADGQPAEATDATTGADPDMGSRPERGPESTNPAAGSGSSPQPGAGSGPQAGAGSSASPGSQSSSEAGSGSEDEPEAEPRTETQSTAGTSSEVAPAADTAHRTEAGIGAKTDIGTEAGAGDTGTNETGTGTRTGADTGPGETAEGAQRRPWLVIALAVVAAVAVVLLLVTALLWPGYLIKPGSPNGAAAEATSALTTKNAGQLAAVTCRDRQGAPLNPLPLQALALIQSVRATGPTVLELDTQARAPIDLTLSAQGQTQTLPADIVLGVTAGHWCMTGISERQ